MNSTYITVYYYLRSRTKDAIYIFRPSIVSNHEIWLNLIGV